MLPRRMATSSSTAPAAANPQALAEATAGANEPLTFSVVIQRSAGVSLGIDVTYSSAAAWTRNGVFIARVFEDGVVASWNAQSSEPHRVRPGDFIFQVNDVFGDTVAMIQEMTAKSHLTIHVLRRAVAATSAPAALQAPCEVQAPSADSAAPPDRPSSHGAGEVAAAPSAASPAESANGEVSGTAGSAVGNVNGVLARSDQTSPVEALLPQLVALGDEALAGLMCVALERRPWLRAAVLAPPTGEDSQPPSGSPDEGDDDKGQEIPMSVSAMQ